MADRVAAADREDRGIERKHQRVTAAAVRAVACAPNTDSAASAGMTTSAVRSIGIRYQRRPSTMKARQATMQATIKAMAAPCGP